MLLSSVLSPTSILLPIKSEERDSVIRELLEVMQFDSEEISREKIYSAILEREAVSSTGIGEGVAIPHAKCDIQEEMVIAFGITEKPVDFHAMDGKPVRIVFLLLSRKNAAGPHIRMLANIARLMRNDRFAKKILLCKTRGEVLHLITEEESEETK
ncbi:MAG: hypothetical protein A2293_03600 [Elusimicrobia bacterium RIFOXYB2_FULL_49_7]|nr:MAG: hypothetical protein A2293_03600 [Elusimicrobia bacterium RIFOXYB2_FULL_49_7]